MEYVKEITVDLSGEMLFDFITAVQGDMHSRYIRITLISNAKQFIPPQDAIAVLRAIKPDKTYIYNDATINEDGTITVELTEQVLAAVGNVRCEITIYDSEESVLTTVPFIVKVTASAVDPGITSGDEYTALAEALARVQKAHDVADSAHGMATEALQNISSVETNIGVHIVAAESAANQALAAAELATQVVTRYGVKFGGSANTGATVSRLYNAVGLVAGVGTDTQPAINDFDTIYPWAGRRRCCGSFNQKGEFVINAYKGEPGYATDGSNGEVWVETQLFYYKHTYGEDNSEEISISSYPITGYIPAPVFVNPDGSLKLKAYIAAYPLATVDGNATSRSGVFSDYGSLNTFMTAARTLGDNYTVTTTAEWYTECLLMWVEFATRNLQNVMKGASSMPYATTDTAAMDETGVNRIILEAAKANAFVVGQTIGIGTSSGSEAIAKNRIITAITDYDESNRAIEFDGHSVNIAIGNVVWTAAYINGSCDGVITSSGSPVSNSDGKRNCVYRGKETPYGNAYEWIADVLFKREGDDNEVPYTYDIYYLPDPTKYSAGAITGDYKKLNFQLPQVDGYVSKLGLDARYPHMRLPSGPQTGSSTTYYADYYYSPRSGICAAIVGGYWSLGPNAGPCYWNCYYAPSGSNVNRRARLSYHRS